MKVSINVVIITFAAVLAPGRASADCPDATDYISPGILASFDLSHRGAFGLGAEMSYNKFFSLETAAGAGAFLNAIHYFAPVRGRFAAGAQADVTMLGAEAGWSLWTGSNDDYGLGMASGPFVGGFVSAGIWMVAIRGSFGSFGDGKAGGVTLDVGYKFAMAVTPTGVHSVLGCYDLGIEH
jgi:hypothetical protein